MDGLLVVNADDLGVTRGATLGILRAHQVGIVTSASLAVTYDDTQHAIDTCVGTCPDLGIGLHLTLTSGRPVSARRDAPLLAGRDGTFAWRFTSLLRAMTFEKRTDLREQIALEIEAQLQTMLRQGIRPDHINGERHVHLIPGIFEEVLAAAQRHNIRYVRLGHDIGAGFVDLAHAGRLLLSGGFLKLALLSGLSRRNQPLMGQGTASADQFASYLYSGRLDLLLSRLLARAPLPGVTEVMVHPGLPEQSVGAALGNSELTRYLCSEDRRAELKACVAARGGTGAWTLTNFTRLAAQAPAA